MPYVLVGVLAALWVVFVSSASGKVRSVGAQRAFADSLVAWRVVPGPLITAVAAAVTAAEVVIVVGATWSLATMTFGGPARLPALATLVVAEALLVALTAGIALALRGGARATCACFGATERPLTAGHLVRDLVLVLATGAGLAIAAGPERSGTLGGTLVGLAAGAVAGLIVVRLDDLTDLFAPGQPGRGRTL